jgi:hypothetical protein
VKQEIVLALRRPGDLVVPFISVQVDLELMQGFLDALAGLSRFIPVVAMIGGSIVTGYELTSQGLSIKGLPWEVR